SYHALIPILKIILLYLHIPGVKQAETSLIMMESRIICILADHIVFKDQSVNGFCKKNGAVKGFKIVVFNHHSFFSFSTMGIFLLMLQIGNLRINRDNSFRKLEHIS